MTYARNTGVPIDRSKAEIERIVMRYGATAFVAGWQQNQATVMFEMNGKRVKLKLALPVLESFSMTPGGRRSRNADATFKAWEQGCREKWRALALVVKAKLEAVESGITTFEEEFMACLVLQGGETLYEKFERGTLKLGTEKLPPLLGA